MALAAQQSLFPESKRRLTHGGEERLGKRKLERPISTRHSMHVVLRSSMAKGEWSLLRPAHAGMVRFEIQRFSRRHGVRIYEAANVGNHIHLLLRARSRDALKRFLMGLSGRIAQRVTGARKGKPLGRRFFDTLPFTRIVSGWGKAFTIAKHYVWDNILEAKGLRQRKPHQRKAGSG
jgi:REP element-mobilizing transposase RayT